MQCLGKLDGPECRIENIMDIFIFPIIFSIRAAITILLLLRVLSIRTVHFILEFIQEMHQWSWFLTWITLTSYTAQFWWSLIQVAFVLLITFYSFFRYVYDFGPKHRKRSLLDILLNPVPGVEFEGRIGETDDMDSFRRRRFNHNLVARRLAWTKRLNQKKMTQSTTSVVYDCRMSYLDPNAPRLHGYESYFTLHSQSMGNQVTEGVHSMPMTLHFAMNQFSCPALVFYDLPRRPPDGIITNALMGILITWIFSLITLQKLMATIHSRHMDRPSDSDTTQNRTIVHDGIIRRHGFYGFISSIVSILCRLPSMKPTANPISCHEGQPIWLHAHIFSIATRLLCPITDFLGNSLTERISCILEEFI